MKRLAIASIVGAVAVSGALMAGVAGASDVNCGTVDLCGDVTPLKMEDYDGFAGEHCNNLLTGDLAYHVEPPGELEGTAYYSLGDPGGDPNDCDNDVTGRTVVFRGVGYVDDFGQQFPECGHRNECDGRSAGFVGVGDNGPTAGAKGDLDGSES